MMPIETSRRQLLFGLVAASVGRAQTAEDPVQVWERFVKWVTALPPEQHDAKVEARYRAYLKSLGYSDADIDVQLKIVEQQSVRAEADRWNRILTAANPRFNIRPNAFLTEMVKDRKRGTALDVGMGQGRNSIWLAQQGWDVTGFDPAEKAVALANETAAKLGVRFKTEIKTMEDFAFGEGRWDLILLSYVGGREKAEVLQRALKRGGLLVLEAFHRDATKIGPIGAAVVFESGEVPALFHGLRVVRYEEPVADADFGQVKVRLVRYCGELVD